TVLARLPAHAQGGAQPAGDVAALTAFARCMRGKGVPDFPDPRPDGRFPIAGTSVEGGKTPALARALAACRQENPDPKGGFVGAQ
ncbi:MAG TPA: hypothetical protein VES42_23035, partial [Pilimelia sp.]|nr:hypothetical protein [Pilimelia sp.]